MNSYEVLNKIVTSKLKISSRIQQELNILENAPIFIVEAFLKAYKHVIIDNNPPQMLNECHSQIAYELGLTTAHPGKISFHYPVQPGAFPDIDIDFAFPDKTKEYIRDKYGEERVIGIPTYGRYRTRVLLKDLCRVVLDENKNRIVSLEEINVLTKKLPFKIDQEVSGDMVDDEDIESDDYELFTNTDIQLFQRKYPRIFEHFKKLYATIKYRGLHAAGLLILPAPAREMLPLSNSKNVIAAEFTEGQGVSELGSLGFIKMDILGLKTLKILDTCNKLIVQRHFLNEDTPSFCDCGREGIPCENNYLLPIKHLDSTNEKLVDFDRLCLNSKKVFQAIGSMQNQGVFQFEPEGISQFAKHYSPKTFYDLALITALYRPGPLDARLDKDGMPLEPGTPEFNRAKSAALFFIDRFHGKIPVSYPSKKVETVLKNSFGILVFQEDISRCIMAMTNCSFMEAEKVRKFLTKVKPEAVKNDPAKIAELKSYEDKFRKQSLDNGCSEKDIKAIWNLLVPFARYGFAKSHAVSYSLISYQTGFCRAFFPLEYLTSLMIHNIDNTDKLVDYIRTAQKLGIKVLPPDLNISSENFSITATNEILCGLEMMKGVGEKAANQIIQNRNEHGIFTSLEDFLNRDIAWRNVTIGVLEVLVKAGALDSFTKNRALTWAKIMVNKNKKKLSDFETIDMFSEDKSNKEIYVEDFSNKEKADHEREYFGFSLEDYISKNKEQISFALSVIKDNARNIKKQATVGTINEIKELTQKNGAKYARVTVTNYEELKESWLIFASSWNIFKDIAKVGETYVSLGKRDEKNTFIVDTMKTMNEVLN